jgi:GNAT superfamily N-acetyltransferase
VVPPAVVRHCREEDWRDVRRLHIALALEFPLVVDVELNEVLATPDDFWLTFVHMCADAPDQALFVAELGDRQAGMGHVHLQDSVARLEMLYVDADQRRQGIGSALVAAQVDWARASGMSELLCHIPEASAGVMLAVTLGWQRTDEIFYTNRGLSERKWTADVAVPAPPAQPS